MRIRQAGPDVSAALADLHADCFARPWTQTAFHDLLDQATTFCLILGEPRVEAALLIGVAAGEAEILTICVRPEKRRLGLAARLLSRAMATLSAQGVERLFLEVAADNAAALALYAGSGFQPVGLRPSYYAAGEGRRVDARVLAFDLTGSRPGPMLA